MEKNIDNLCACQTPHAKPPPRPPLRETAECRQFPPELRGHFGTAKGEVYHHLNDLVLEFMQSSSPGKYHPAVRFNAMLAIGELAGADRPGAPPLPEALKVLVAR